VVLTGKSLAPTAALAGVGKHVAVVECSLVIRIAEGRLAARIAVKEEHASAAGPEELHTTREDTPG
jgi:hypothetical protein